MHESSTSLAERGGAVEERVTCVYIAAFRVERETASGARRRERETERESKRVARSRVASRSRERGKVREEERAAGAKNGEEKEAARKRNKDAVVAENSGLPDDQATSCETHGRSLKDTAVFVSGGWTALCRRRNELRARRAALDSYMTTTLFYEPDCSTSSRRLATLSARLCS